MHDQPPTDVRDRTLASRDQWPERRRFELTENFGSGSGQAKFVYYDRAIADYELIGDAFTLYDSLDLFAGTETGDRGWCVRMSDSGRWEVLGPRRC